ncbi:MAG: indolepyruvate ferredoxin oxidoreductase family protein [Pseudomonadota bacterium]
MELLPVSLKDRYDLTKTQVLLSGTQALVRLPMMQKLRDKASGHDTAGYITGYRGSPLGGVDLNMSRANAELSAHDITFNPGLNEDLAATALWGTQQAQLRGEGTHDGVFGMWYAKGPGVDRSGDVFRHANMAGTADLGGVIACMGDDHTGESSTVLHHSEFAFVDALMPVLSPAGVQEVLDYGVLGWALSRFSGCWVGLKCVKDTIEVSEVVNGDPHRLTVVTPTEFEMPEDGLNIRLIDTPVAQEARLHDYKRFAAEAFGRANKIDKRVHGDKGARIGIVSSGKSWLDTAHALDLLGLDAGAMRALGITTYKVGMVWPLDTLSFCEWAQDLDLIIVVEEKRKLIEVQIKEAIFNDRRGRRVIGWKDEEGRTVFTVKEALDPVKIAQKLGGLLAAEGIEPEATRAARARIDAALTIDNTPALAERQPWFCSGCPHNSSTKLPEGSRAYAGIGCHYMVQWMDRETTGFTHMGGEGANWIGEAPFSKRNHIFQNLGDGTYNHSGVQAIRAALAAGTTITYKILYNDAVAMTGGQPNDGNLSPQQITAELLAMGVGTVVGVYDPKEDVDPKSFPVPMRPRSELMQVQKEMEAVEGVSAIVYIQTCAAEKRRRRKRGLFPDPDRRVFINPAVCEGCGDCGVQSNCVAILPLETPMGRKRQIDQSACNKDFSCLNGFCPSFVTVEGGVLNKSAAQDIAIPKLADPVLPAIKGTYNLVITGVGGTGVVTVGALLGMAAHLEGKGSGVMEMAGLAQKGGAVHIHCRIADSPSDISAVRVAVGEADALIGGDLVVSAGPKTLALLTRDKTRAVLNTHEINTGAFTRDTEFKLPTDRLMLSLRARIGADALNALDATEVARQVLGDAIYANVLMLGAAWQAGLIPLSEAAILKAIELNGAGVAGNSSAFQLGRWAIAEPMAVSALLKPDEDPQPATLQALTDQRAAHLTGYQSKRLAKRYRTLVAKAGERDAEFARAVALGYAKLLSYKDEYEVARLHHETLVTALGDTFARHTSLKFHLAPPFLGRKDAQGRPRKTEFGPWMMRAFGLLRRFKVLRGTPLDPFGYTAERRMERNLIREYEADMAALIADWPEAHVDIAIALAELPLQIRGFGHVKQANAETAANRRDELLAGLTRPPLAAAAE